MGPVVEAKDEFGRRDVDGEAEGDTDRSSNTGLEVGSAETTGIDEAEIGEPAVGKDVEMVAGAPRGTDDWERVGTEIGRLYETAKDAVHRFSRYVGRSVRRGGWLLKATRTGRSIPDEIGAEGIVITMAVIVSKQHNDGREAFGTRHLGNS